MRSALAALLLLGMTTQLAGAGYPQVHFPTAVGRQYRTQVTSADGKNIDYFAGGGVVITCSGTSISMTSDSVAAYSPGVSCSSSAMCTTGLDRHHGCRQRHLLQGRRALGSSRQRPHGEPCDRFHDGRPEPRLSAGGKGSAGHGGDVFDRPAHHSLHPEGLGRRQGRALRHCWRPHPAEGREPGLGRGEGHHRPERPRCEGRLALAPNRQGRQGIDDRRPADAAWLRQGHLRPGGAAHRLHAR